MTSTFSFYETILELNDRELEELRVLVEVCRLLGGTRIDFDSPNNFKKCQTKLPTCEETVLQ